ncbi:metalloprotease family protein [Clostridium tertium]
MKKSRYLVITILPFIMLSFVLPFIMTLMGFDPMIILTLSIINSAGSSVDVLSFLLLVLQIPKNGIIRNNGINTFYINN